jgi:hypothetical protein
VEKTCTAANQDAGQHIFNQKEVPHGDIGAMKEKNVKRLLARFMKHFDQTHA